MLFTCVASLPQMEPGRRSYFRPAHAKPKMAAQRNSIRNIWRALLQYADTGSIVIMDAFRPTRCVKLTDR